MVTQKKEQSQEILAGQQEAKQPLICGIIMPISGDDEYSTSHWKEVRSIINRAIERVNFVGKLVSESDDVTIIQKSIIENIYKYEIAVCDVSNKNPNVMFELGMRLAFDMPVVIIKDDFTDYSFDTSIIEHLNYRKDLRFFEIESFIDNLSKKIINTHEKYASGEFKFLKHFSVDILPKNIPKETIDLKNYIDSGFSRLSKEISLIKNGDANNNQKIVKIARSKAGGEFGGALNNIMIPTSWETLDDTTKSAGLVREDLMQMLERMKVEKPK